MDPGNHQQFLSLGTVADSSLAVTRITRVLVNTTPAALANSEINANTMRSCFIKRPSGHRTFPLSQVGEMVTGGATRFMGWADRYVIAPGMKVGR